MSLTHELCDSGSTRPPSMAEHSYEEVSFSVVLLARRVIFFSGKRRRAQTAKTHGAAVNPAAGKVLSGPTHPPGTPSRSWLLCSRPARALLHKFRLKGSCKTPVREKAIFSCDGSFC